MYISFNTYSLGLQTEVLNFKSKKMTPIRLAKLDREKLIIEKIKAGFSIEEIKNIIGVSDYTVRMAIKNAGILTPKQMEMKKIREESKDLFLKGKRMKEVMQELELSNPQVRAMRTEFHFRPEQTFAKERKLRTMEKILSGKDIDAIAAEEGLKYSTVKTWSKAVQEGRYEEFLARVERQYLQGSSIEEIAREQCLTIDTVNKILRKYKDI